MASERWRRADSSGRPDMKSLAVCMTGKGFSRFSSSSPGASQGNPASFK
ncbi:MAG: hypothetical protein WC825_09465 [Gallionellaceae bacterium]